MKKDTFEEKLKLSREILDRIMDPEITLEESVKLYEQGLKTIKEAQDMLEEARLKVENIEKKMNSAGDEKR